MSDLRDLHNRHILLMQHTLGILGNVLAGADPATMTTVRDPNDGEKGWTALEVLCHLRDYDEIFYQRACLILEQEYPSLPRYDHEALAIERRYNEQDFHHAYADLERSRRRFVQFFQGLNAAQWARAGVHPERGHFTITDACAQVGTHEALHLEQMTRILRAG